METEQLINQFAVPFASGAKTLALHPVGLCFAAGVSARSRGTVAVYNIPRGTELWCRGRLRYPSRLRFSPSGDHLYCTINNSKIETIEVSTGIVVAVSPGTKGYFQGSYGFALIEPSSGPVYQLVDQLAPARDGIAIAKLTFAPLDVAFGPASVFVTEAVALSGVSNAVPGLNFGGTILRLAATY